MSVLQSFRRFPLRTVLAAIGVCLVVATFAALTSDGDRRAVAYFSTAKGLYPGSEVQILGIEVGKIDSVQPAGQQVRVEFHYDAKYQVPAGARAVITAPALVTSRHVELTPAYTKGPVLADGAVIPRSRTAVPVEFDEIKEQVNALSAALGPAGANKTGAIGRLLDTTARYRGQGGSLRDTIEQLSKAMQTISDSRGDLFGTVRNLQTFVSALAASDEQIVQFTRRLDGVSGVLADNKTELAGAVKDLNAAAVAVEKFLRDNRGDAKRSTEKMTEVVRVVSRQRQGLEHALHTAPTLLMNFYNIYDGRGGYTGAPVLAHMQNPGQFVCGLMGAATDKPPKEAVKLCKKELGPLLQLLQMNYPPISANATVPSSRGGR